MHTLADICIRRPVFASMIVLSLVVVGAAAYLGLGVDRFPSVDLPTVRVQTVLPGASPEEVEVLVSQRLEEVINTVEGISELRSVSGQGISLVLITFDLNRNVDVAAQDVRDRVATVLNRLPRDARPPVIAKFDNDSTPVMSIALSGNRSVRELTELADKVAKVQFERRPASARCSSSVARSARSACGSTPTASRPTASPSARCATRWCARTPTCRAATSRPTSRSACCGRWAASRRRPTSPTS